MLNIVATPNYTAIGAVVLVVVAAACDIRSRRIPNVLVFSSGLLALAAQCVAHGIGDGLAAWAVGGLTGLAILLPFYLVRGMAAGDVKLMMAVGAWVGLSQVATIALATFVLGGIWALGITLARRRARQLLRNMAAIATDMVRHVWKGRAKSHDDVKRVASVGSLPYGVAIALGTIGVLFAQE
jgi:prepilin peptidase CpaA